MCTRTPSQEYVDQAAVARGEAPEWGALEHNVKTLPLLPSLMEDHTCHSPQVAFYSREPCEHKGSYLLKDKNEINNNKTNLLSWKQEKMVSTKMASLPYRRVEELKTLPLVRKT